MSIVPRPLLRSLPRALAVGAALLSGACSEDFSTATGPGSFGDFGCDLPPAFFTDSGLGRGGIPTLLNPEFVSAEPSPQNAYLLDTDRVLGFILDGLPMAVPHNILWYHEVVNLDRGAEHIAITYCPLTGSTMGFDRTSIGGQELGVSGLLFMNNFLMFNRGDPESLWPQMLGEAKCKADIGRTLDRFPIFEMTWQAWKGLHPETTVISSEVNISRDYTLYPYGDYELLSNSRFLFPAMPRLDERRPAKERVLGLPSTKSGEPGIAFPFGALEEEPSSWTVIETEWNGEEVVLLWADVPAGGGVFSPFHPVTGERLWFRTAPSRGIEDTTTGTLWSITGEAIAGELLGLRLEPVAEAYVAFWGAWAAFHPATRLWQGG
jgi:uncharacterized protein DUF3179